eukprot:TRINITY_DN12761_c0_g1_i1.p1 TRINITY_DN12761_c0_g1~~TRINITY_DN12761_c0_g1_i1.p1  ORF type:complete len:160 (-),score=24.42 TRINITY_DN12761_c0_g1_i1:70-495(-)
MGKHFKTWLDVLLYNTNTGLGFTGLSALAAGVPALVAPHKVHSLWIPTTVYSEGLGLAIRMLGALLVSASCGLFCVKATEDIDSKRATLQGAATFSLLGGIVAYVSKQLWEPVAWKVAIAASAFGFVSQSYYGCLVASSRP